MVEVRAIFTGQYTHTIDSKGRVIMPSHFRKQLGDSFVITRGYEGCLNVYSNEEWENFAARLMSMPEHNADARRLLRMFASGAVICEADKQGRVLLPLPLREHAGIAKDVTIIGAISRVEIWDSGRWTAYNTDENALTIEEAAANLSKFER